MMSRFVKKGWIALLFLSSLQVNAQTRFTGGSFKLSLDKKGFVTELGNKETGKNYLYADTVAPLLTVVSNKARLLPSGMLYNKAQKKITLEFAPSAIQVDIKLTEKPAYLVLEVIKATPENQIEAIVWGPFPTTVSKTIGEVIGVVRDGETSVGLQVLNVKTLGGDYPNSEGSTWTRVIAAVARPWGSFFQAYSINRSHSRVVDAWGGQFKNMPVPAIKGESVAGSKIALFSCAEPQTLDRLERIEIDEHLPHPLVNGVWFKKSPLFGKSYLISSFGEQDVDEMIAYTKKAGLISLYHEGPFQNWGHFVLNPKQFPKGNESFKNCVDKTHAAGLFFGFHTLTNFINTNDAYITPVPDDRLSMTGSSSLVAAIDADQKEIEVASPEYFSQQENNNLHTVKIGKELVRYKSVTSDPPYKLLDCQRGAFGTAPSAHSAADAVGKLFDHGYGVFFPNITLQHEVAKNVAAFMNATGADHLDFDGHEGGLATGEGDYGAELFSKDVHDNVKHDFICGTSRSSTFFWHMGSYYNWGEPWYGGFKESMQQYRVDNQGLFDRNYMPHMLGWYLLSENTTLSEMEWMLARAAGYSAGFAMVARPDALRKNSLTPQLLDAIREWEMARTGNAFSKAQQDALKDPKNEFHLEKLSEGKWSLYQYASSPVFVREAFERQPGEPTSTTWNFQQGWKEQPLRFQLNTTGTEGSVSNIKLQVDSYAEFNLMVELSAGESLVCDGTQTIRVYDKNGKPKNKLALPAPPPVTSGGAHTIIIDCSFSGTVAPKIEVQFKGLDKMESIQLNKGK
jgi:hypothetical protein